MVALYMIVGLSLVRRLFVLSFNPFWDSYSGATLKYTVEPLREAARRLITRHKISMTKRFNALLKGREEVQ